MYQLKINESSHDFEKKNLVTIPSSRGGYDELVCKKCGIKGKTFQLGILQVKGSYSREKVENCILTKEEMKSGNTGRTIIITICTAQGPAFKNVTPDSEHVVIETPKGQTIDSKGVWITGNGEPVKVLNNEFYYKNK
jgi:hypothetical protein